MIHGIGTDILKIDHIATIFNVNPDDAFFYKTFTKNELTLINNRSNPLYSYATRFAGKEAVFKSLGIGGNDIRLDEIEILELENGQPCVILLGRAREIADKKGISQVLISLSYDTDYAIAYATSLK
jgi:phosphopantetheine--protein transferase-like protein